MRRRRWRWSINVVARTQSTTEDAPNREKKVELLVPNLKEILRIKLHWGVAGKMENPFNKAAVLSEDFEGESAALEVVEDAGMVAGDVHAAAEGSEVDIDGGFLGVAAEDDGVGLHVVLEILTLKLREPCLHVAAASASACAVRHC
uniref:Uncharacterized protein n=1 Tax=Opuntia streptacantha TaxID=393608 RepID=A0A7C8ZFJ8_OPUST